jgi:glyoxylase-like metal-dependent hydrolase (beta-lactamase superfamily II)
VTVRWLEIGHARVAALLDGEADLSDPIEASFPDMPLEGVLASRDAMPRIFGADNHWHLFVRAWLVVHPGGVVLVDTGVGDAFAPAASWFAHPGELHTALREAGSSPDQIDTVVITHVHDDHLGGAVSHTEGRRPAFANARYVIQRADLEWLRRLSSVDGSRNGDPPDANAEEARIILDTLVRPLEDAGSVEAIDGHHRLSDAIELRHAPGHTPGHQIVRVVSRDRRLLIAGDTFNHPAQIAHPDWPSGTDDAAASAARARRSVLADALSHPGMIVSPSHFDEPFGVIASERGGLAEWRPT